MKQATQLPEEGSCVRRTALLSCILGLLSFVASILTGIPAIVLGLDALDKHRDNMSSPRTRRLAVAGIASGAIGSIASGTVLLATAATWWMTPRQESTSVPSASLAVAKTEPQADANPVEQVPPIAQNHLKQIAISFFTFSDSHRRGQFPSRDNVTDQGPSGISWRVHLLPFLNEEWLHGQFNHDEPWDSEQNQTLLSRMPVFFSSERKPGGQTTRFLVPVGPGILYERTGGPDRRDLERVPTYRTILVVEANDDFAVPWTKPADYAFRPNEPLRGLGAVRDGGFLAVMADGSVSLVPVNTDQKILNDMFAPPRP